MKAKKEKTIETRKSEVRFTTSDPKEMLGKFLASKLTRGWTEDFVDKETNEVVTVERNEIIAMKGNLIDKELLSQIQFFLQSGDIKEVEVSNQRRMATLNSWNHLYIWSVTVQMRNKKRRFLLYANSILTAYEVIKDFIELNYDDPFDIISAKIHPSAIILTDKLKSALPEESEDDSTDEGYYQIDVNVTNDELTYTQTFIIQAKNVDSAMIAINHAISKEVKRQRPDAAEFITSVASAVTIPCYRVIEREFSEAYLGESGKEE